MGLPALMSQSHQFQNYQTYWYIYTKKHTTHQLIMVLVIQALF